MRKILNSMMLGLSAVLALVGCGGGTSDVGDSTVTEPDVITEWRSEDITNMNTVLGRVIPVAPMSSNYVGTTFEHETLKTVIYLYDETIEDQGEAYGEILLAAGYTFFRMYEETFYDIYEYYYAVPHDGVRDFVTVQYFYYTGNQTTTPRFIVYAWFEDGGRRFEEWPADALVETLGITETIPSFVANAYIFKYVPRNGCYGIYGYTTDATVEATYTSTLEGAGWTIDNSRYDDGYGIYADSPEGEIRLQYAFVDNLENDNGDMLVVYIYVNDAEEDTPSE